MFNQILNNWNESIEGQDQRIEVIPERRLIASVLQRSLIDLLQMYERDERIEEVENETCECEDEVYRNVSGTTRERYFKNGFKEKWRARELIRWFRSEDEVSSFSFRWILKELGIESYHEEILRIAEEDTIKDHPFLQNMI